MSESNVANEGMGPDPADMLLDRVNALRTQLAEARKRLAEHDEEIDEFNAGYEAAARGESLDDEPAGLKHDQWTTGWWWCMGEKFKARAEKAEAEVGRLRKALEPLATPCPGAPWCGDSADGSDWCATCRAAKDVVRVLREIFDE